MHQDTKWAWLIVVCKRTLKLWIIIKDNQWANFVKNEGLKILNRERYLSYFSVSASCYISEQNFIPTRIWSAVKQWRNQPYSITRALPGSGAPRQNMDRAAQGRSLGPATQLGELGEMKIPHGKFWNSRVSEMPFPAFWESKVFDFRQIAKKGRHHKNYRLPVGQTLFFNKS